jgi:uncharacterized membrane protein (DUF2068 family)
MDWNLFGCARRGHVTYAPDEPALRDRLMAPTAGGTAWRCLRCGAFVTGGPHGGGPAAAAPLIRRGKELRSDLILRVFAVERFLRFLIVGGAAYGVWRFKSGRAGIERAYNNDLPAIRALYRDLGFDVNHSRLLGLIQHSFMLTPRTLTYLAIGLAAYAVTELAESIGLWLGQRWGEYFAMVATSIFLPLEVYDLTVKITWLRVAALVINLLLVIYLVWAKRLFGVRGGKTAYEARLRSESVSRWSTPRSPRHRPASPVMPSPLTRRSSQPAINHAGARYAGSTANRSWTGPAAQSPARKALTPGPSQGLVGRLSARHEAGQAPPPAGPAGLVLPADRAAACIVWPAPGFARGPDAVRRARTVASGTHRCHRGRQQR